MNVIINPTNEILVALGKQPRFKNKNYRLNKFCVVENIMNGKLIFNCITRSMVFISNKEFSTIYDKELNTDYIKFLYENYFLIEENTNEHEIVQFLREKLRTPIDDFYLDKITEYTILTTTACNARCFYCYEQNIKKETMTVETADKILQYMFQKSPKDKVIDLHWFGGEPLFNMKVIDKICNGLKEEGYMFTTRFTTNGYLFDKDIIKKGIELWNLKEAQITIDGTENVYNKAKNYIYKKDKSPYQRVVKNIEELLNNNIAVHVRMNVDMHNCDDLKDLVYEFYERFGNHPFLSLYCYPIFENEFYQRKEGERQIVFEKIAEIEKVMEDCKYSYGSSMFQVVRFNHCMADNGKSVTISPSGNVGLCEHTVQSDFIGHIDEPNVIDFDMLNTWKVYEKDIDICSDCPVYPNCVRLSKCEEQSKCYPEYKEWNIRKFKKTMVDTYYNIIENNY